MIFLKFLSGNARRSCFVSFAVWLLDMFVFADIFFYPFKASEYAGFVSGAGFVKAVPEQGFWKKNTIRQKGGWRFYFQNLHDLVQGITAGATLAHENGTSIRSLKSR